MAPLVPCLRLCTYPKRFLRGGFVVVFKITTFFPPSSYFPWSNGFDKSLAFCFKYFVIDSLPLIGRYFCKQMSPFLVDNRHV